MSCLNVSKARVSGVVSVHPRHALVVYNYDAVARANDEGILRDAKTSFYNIKVTFHTLKESDGAAKM